LISVIKKKPHRTHTILEIEVKHLQASDVG